jgi:hypothetical protein
MQGPRFSSISFLLNGRIRTVTITVSPFASILAPMAFGSPSVVTSQPIDGLYGILDQPALRAFRDLKCVGVEVYNF